MSRQRGEFDVNDLGHFTDDDTEPRLVRRSRPLQRGWSTILGQPSVDPTLRPWHAPPHAGTAQAPEWRQPWTQGRAVDRSCRVLAVGIGSIFSSDEDNAEADQASATSTEVPAAMTTPAPAVVPSVAPRTPVRPAPTTAEATPAAGCLDVPGDVLATVNASLETSGYEFGSPAAYDDGDTLYVTGEIVELQDGGIRSRDDVFAQQGPILTPVTVTARNESNLLDLYDELDLDFLDPGSQAAADCARTY